MTGFESVIGLEVHAQLRTRSKLFCGCSTAYGAPPNTLTCPVCLGHPGALPVLNRHAVELGVRAASAFGCTIHGLSRFARKNYFYPDLPKGYQITQYDRPLATGGAVAIEVAGRTRRIRLARVHLEEDAGKSIHDGMPDSDRASYVDLDRAGVPLIEIVSEPDLREPEEAYLFLQRLRSILRYTRVCDGNLEEGSLRCDANVSVRPEGSTELGTRTELKNLNSFRNVQRALEYEIARQVEIVRGGGHVEHETLLYDAASGKTRAMRGKEAAHDYRYFPEPDLPPLAVDPLEIDRVRSKLPELPAERKARLIASHGIAEPDAHRLTFERELADYFEAVAAACGNPKAASNFILNDLAREQKAAGRGEDDIPLEAKHLAELIRLVDSGTIGMAAAREVFQRAFREGRSPTELVRDLGLRQVRDVDVVRDLARKVIEAHPREVERYRRGKTTLFGFFVGETIKASGGTAHPPTVHAVLKELL